MSSTITPDFFLEHFSQLDREVESKQGAVDFLGRGSRDQRSGLQRSEVKVAEVSGFKGLVLKSWFFKKKSPEIHKGVF